MFEAEAIGCIRYGVYRLSTIDPKGRKAVSYGSKTFYKTYTEAFKFANQCCQESGKPIVIMATLTVLKPAEMPIEVLDFGSHFSSLT